MGIVKENKRWFITDNHKNLKFNIKLLLILIDEELVFLNFAVE